MVIKRTPGVFTRASIASGSVIQEGNLVSLLNGEAVLADNTMSRVSVGFAKSIENGIVYIQVNGKINNSESGTEYWTGPSGNMLSSPPTSGLVQKVAERIDNQNVLITIDKTVILI